MREVVERRAVAQRARSTATRASQWRRMVHPEDRGGCERAIGRAVRTERHRLVEWKKPGAPTETAILELYDYVADPEETKNLANSQPVVVARLQALLAKQPEAKPQVRAAAEMPAARTK